MRIGQNNHAGREREGSGAEQQSRRDAELVAAVRGGDKRAFVEIVARHQAMVCGLALGILGDFAASEDAGQEAFLTAWKKIGELREPERLRSWLGQIARNTALAHLRWRKGEEPVEEGLELADAAPAPDEAAANSEEAALVCEVLAKLPENYRLPLVLYYREGQSVRAVAEALSLTEEAVRQRLARGREMLRERMTGLVETVLTRTGPTAVFTVAVAVAIGALAAPAAIAGGVFASVAAGVGTAPAAGSTTASIFGAMSTKTLVTAALVLAASVPIGYGLRVATSAPTAKLAAASPDIAPAPVNISGLQFQDSAWYAEWRHLHEVYGSGKEAMPLLYKAIKDMKDSFQRRAFTAALISEWVQVDAAGGFGFFSADGRDGAERRQLFEEWLAREPDAAITAFLATGKPWKSVVRDSLVDIAKAAPARLAEVVSALPKPENEWDDSVKKAFAAVAQGALEQARMAAESLTGPNRQQALEGVATAWAKSNPAAALNWAKSLPPGTDQDELIRCALVGLAGVNAAAALDQVGIVPSGSRPMFFASTTGARVLSAAAENDFDGTLAWITSHPGRLTSEDLLGMAQQVTSRLNANAAGFLSDRANDGSLAGIVPAIGSALLNGSAEQRGAVWAWLQNQPDSDAIKRLKDDVLNSASWQDPALALSLANQLPATPAGDEEIKTIARSLLNGGSMLYRFDAFYAQAPARLRAPLLEAAFTGLRSDNLDNPQTWLDRISQLPVPAQAEAQHSLMLAWAEQSPEQALGWAQALPDGSRDAAEATIVSTWAATDPASAEAWLSSLPAGAERDQSAQQLAMAIAEKHPGEAWGWALNIGNETLRTATATQVAQLMAARDVNTARQWVEASALPPETKAQVEAALTKGH